MAPLKVTTINNEIDPLELELTMEKIRQTASKITWEGLAGALRRNMMDKRSTLDINDRLDIQRALAIFRRSLPIEETGDLSTKLRQLADSLECQFLVEPGLVFIKNADLTIEIRVEASEVKSAKIMYFNGAPLVFEAFGELVANNEWEKIRNGIHSVIASVASFQGPERSQAAQALSTFEAWIASQGLVKKGSDPNSWNKLPLGALLPRSALRPARLFFAVEPVHLAKFNETPFDIDKDADLLPYFEILVTPCDRETKMPTSLSTNDWSSLKSMKACFTFKFSSPFVFSASVWRSLQEYLAKPSSIKEHVNLYRYLSGFDVKKRQFILKASIDGEQFFYYEIPVAELREESDVVVGELHLADGRDLKTVLTAVRSQFAHNAYFKSLLAWTVGHKGREPSSLIRIHTSISAKSFDFTFGTDARLSIARFHEQNGEWKVRCEDTDGNVIDPYLDNEVSVIFRKCWSIPVIIRYLLQSYHAKFETDFGAMNLNEAVEPMETDSKENFAHLQSDKLALSWLRCFRRTKKETKRERAVFTVEEPLLEDGTKPSGLLELWKEREERPMELIPPQEVSRMARRDMRDMPMEPLLASRTAHRLVSDTTLQKNAVSDLDEIAKLAQNIDDDYQPRGGVGGGGGGQSGHATPTQAYPTHHPFFGGGAPPSGVSPRGYHSHINSYMAGVPPSAGAGGGQLSPLETARQKMNQVVGGAADMFDFPDETSSQGSFPSPHYGSTGGFNTPSYMSAGASPLGASYRGQPMKRRGRGRKSGNIGDREGSVESPGPQPVRKPRGPAPGSRRGRGVRKSVGGDHVPFDQRPPIARTLSDAPYSNEPPTPFSSSSSHSPFIESDSEEETDPPKYIPPSNLSLQQGMGGSSIITGTVPPSPAALAAQSVVVPPVSQPLNSNFGSTSPRARKSSIDMNSKASPSSSTTPTTSASSFPHLNAMTSTIQPKPRAISDLYDDGTESPPPSLSVASNGGETTPSNASNAPSVHISPVPIIERKPSNILPSPIRASNMFEAALAAGDIPPIKIPKDPKATRGSPSVESMKSKSLSKQISMDKLEKKDRGDKEKEREKKEKIRRESVDSSDKKDILPGPKSVKLALEEKRKRKLEREREDSKKEHKKHKLDRPEKEREKEKKEPSFSAVNPPLPFMQSLSSFKIPKKSNTEAEKEPTASTPTSSAPVGGGFGERRESLTQRDPRDNRDTRDPRDRDSRDRDRDRERSREKPAPLKQPPMRPHPGMGGMPPMARGPPPRVGDPSQIPLPPPPGAVSGTFFNRKPPPLPDTQRKPSGPHMGQRPPPGPGGPGGNGFRWQPPPSSSSSAVSDRAPQTIPISALPAPASPSPEPLPDPDSPDGLKIVEE